VGLEPTRTQGTRDFKSLASTTSATQAFSIGLRLRHLLNVVNFFIAMTASVGGQGLKKAGVGRPPDDLPNRSIKSAAAVDTHFFQHNRHWAKPGKG
jgi:hypothetical protein